MAWQKKEDSACSNAQRSLKWRLDMMEKSINLVLEVNQLIFQHDFIC